MHREIRGRTLRTEDGRHAFGIPRREAAGAIERPTDPPEPDGPFGWRTGAWHADKFHWRLETNLPGGGLVWEHRVEAGPREHDPPWFALANDHYWTFYALLTDEICGISGELGPLDLTVEDRIAWVGRQAWRLVGRPGANWDWDTDPLSWGADEYEVLVDAERGVLLRCASRLRGEGFDALEVEEIHFDESLDSEVFASRQPLPWP